MNYLSPIVRQGIGTQYGDNFRYDVYSKDPANIVRNANVSTWYNPNPAPPQYSVKFIPDRQASADAYEMAAGPLSAALAAGSQASAEQAAAMGAFWNNPRNYGAEGAVGGPGPDARIGVDATPPAQIGVASSNQPFDPEAALKAILDAGAPKGRIVMSGALPPEAREWGLRQRMMLDMGDGPRQAAMLKELSGMQTRRMVADAEARKSAAEANAMERGSPGQMISLGIDMKKEGLPGAEDLIRIGMSRANPSQGTPSAAAPGVPSFREQANALQAYLTGAVPKALNLTPSSYPADVGTAILGRLEGEQPLDDQALGELRNYLSARLFADPKWLQFDQSNPTVEGEVLRSLRGLKGDTGLLEAMRNSKASAQERLKHRVPSLIRMLSPSASVGNAAAAPGRYYSPYGP